MQNGDFRVPTSFERAVKDLAGRLAPDWEVSCDAPSADYPVRVSLTHPVSAGHEWMATRAQVEAEDLTILAASISRSRELSVRPPITSNAHLLRGLRTVAVAFHWSGDQMSALAGVLEQSGILTADERRWLRQVGGSFP